ncbi:hypothetical protein BC832DRAFT_556687 [Gaertneriomyces semiglobifer]|nr:hypothetical protein BC832DRAFT_556687 [Gaertneriomyces semiglobifer]
MHLRRPLLRSRCPPVVQTRSGNDYIINCPNPIYLNGHVPNELVQPGWTRRSVENGTSPASSGSASPSHRTVRG